MRAPRPFLRGFVAAAPVALAFFLLLSGCGPHDPLAETVDASNPESLELWLGRASDSLSPADYQRFTQAESDIKLDLMAHASGSGGGLEQRFCDTINGKTVRDVIILGLHDRINRLQGDLTEARRLLADNSKIKGVDDASRSYLQRRVSEDQSRVNADESQLSAAQNELQQLTTAPHP